ncbi:hypothetical protein BDR26DRAFT_856314 [Obelidium mucronatum]|nr:hypothetical protein BDR26DRAFT_856314 [Obelidium mucronatum]
MASQQPPQPPIDRRLINGPFYSGLFLTLFAGPIIGAIPLCCADPNNLLYRGYYIRGMAFAIATGSALILALTIIIVQACNSSNDNYYTVIDRDGFIQQYYYYVNCNALYSRLIPVAVIWGIVSIALFRRSKMLIANAASLASGQAVLVQVVTTNGAPQMGAPMMVQSYGAQPQAYGQSYAQPYAQPYGQPEQPGAPSFGAPQPSNGAPYGPLPGYTPMADVKQPTYAEPPGPPPPQSFGGPSPPSPLAPALSLESLALQLELPKILTVTEGIDGVLGMGYNEMNEKYGITAEEFMKIKAYRKTVGK